MQIDVILDARAKPQELAELGQLAERCGIHGVWVSSLLDSRDPFANLALLAHGTSRIRLGPIAVNPFDTHPVKIASALLTLNEIASGRSEPTQVCCTAVSLGSISTTVTNTCSVPRPNSSTRWLDLSMVTLVSRPST